MEIRTQLIGGPYDGREDFLLMAPPTLTIAWCKLCKQLHLRRQDMELPIGPTYMLTSHDTVSRTAVYEFVELDVDKAIAAIFEAATQDA